MSAVQHWNRQEVDHRQIGTDQAEKGEEVTHPPGGVNVRHLDDPHRPRQALQRYLASSQASKSPEHQGERVAGFTQAELDRFTRGASGLNEGQRLEIEAPVGIEPICRGNRQKGHRRLVLQLQFNLRARYRLL